MPALVAALRLWRLLGPGAGPAQNGTLRGRGPTGDPGPGPPRDRPPFWWDLTEPTDSDAHSEYRANLRQWYNGLQLDWMVAMHQGGLREKMVLFWHNHLVTQGPRYSYNAPLAYNYLETLRRNALGNFRTLVREMGLTPAMLLYLDGARNTQTAPNENYAREVMELFTLGLGEYSQQDIAEAARALTGYTVDVKNLQVHFDPQRFDDGEKTFLGRTGRFTYDDVVDIIFTERAEAVAHHIATKLFRFFVYETPKIRVIKEIKEELLAADFEIAPVLQALLGSVHFFNGEYVGAQIKSPVELLHGLYFHGDKMPTDQDNTIRRAANLDQDLLNPPNVAGWPGHRAWISTQTFPRHWSYGRSFIYDQKAGRPDIVALAQKMPAPHDPTRLALDLAHFWLAVDLPQNELDKLPQIMLDDLPEDEWNIAHSGTTNKLLAYFNYIVELPEYQLN
ncbi:MAG: DUF1800 family protein [Candidatus Latescibacteria bacterium]|nr:DUF1800 family protein [Candidatus Latescibacterota bacterium]